MKKRSVSGQQARLSIRLFYRHKIAHDRAPTAIEKFSSKRPPPTAAKIQIGTRHAIYGMFVALLDDFNQSPEEGLNQYGSLSQQLVIVPVPCIPKHARNTGPALRLLVCCQHINMSPGRVENLHVSTVNPGQNTTNRVYRLPKPRPARFTGGNRQTNIDPRPGYSDKFHTMHI
jgi:hypothetical protein